MVRDIAHKNIKYSLDHYNLGLGEDDDEADKSKSHEVTLDDKLMHLDRQVKVICENVRRLTLQTS